MVQLVAPHGKAKCKQTTDSLLNAEYYREQESKSENQKLIKICWHSAQATEINTDHNALIRL